MPPTKDVIALSLTGPDSHRATVEAGQGSFSFGPAGTVKPALDVTVPAEAAIDWTAFERHGRATAYPWPRQFHYTGNDTGFAAWSQGRPIETFTWRPAAPAVLDLSAARIGNFELLLTAFPVTLTLGPQQWLGLRGDLSRLTLQAPAGGALPEVTLAPSCRLPPLPALHGLTRLSIVADVLAPGFDCADLLQFPALQSLQLYGHVTGLGHLKALERLTSLQLRYCRDLNDLPPLDSWPALDSVLAWNVEATAATRLKAEVTRLKRAGRVLTRASITKPRPAAWFAEDAALPFGGWPTKTAKLATQAYRAAAAALLAGKPWDEAMAAFMEAMNALPGIETSEREDIAAAVQRLAMLCPSLDPAEAMSGFDRLRDF